MRDPTKVRRLVTGWSLLYCGLYCLYESTAFAVLLQDEKLIRLYPLCMAMMTASEWSGNRYIFWFGYFALIPFGVAFVLTAVFVHWPRGKRSTDTPQSF